MNSVPESHRKQGNDVIRLRKNEKTTFWWLAAERDVRAEPRGAALSTTDSSRGSRSPAASRGGEQQSRAENPAPPQHGSAGNGCRHTNAAPRDGALGEERIRDVSVSEHQRDAELHRAAAIALLGKALTPLSEKF